jgi:hypothetical protein
MTPPPTFIDGQEITGATIDGQEVQEITIDGQTVFTAAEFPVAYTNLVAWYPFDSSFYGGANADDVTAILGGSGDDTAFDGTVNGATYQSSGGNNDINTGDGSGYYDFDSNDGIDMETDVLTSFGANGNPFSFSAWFKFTNLFNDNYKAIMGDGFGRTWLFHWRSGLNAGVGFTVTTPSGDDRFQSGANLSNGEWFHAVGTFDGSANINLYVDATNKTDLQGAGSNTTSSDFYIGNYGNSAYDSANEIDDVRVYNKELSGSEVSQIFSNTKPSSKP